MERRKDRIGVQQSTALFGRALVLHQSRWLTIRARVDYENPHRPFDLRDIHNLRGVWVVTKCFINNPQFAVCQVVRVDQTGQAEAFEALGDTLRKDRIVDGCGNSLLRQTFRLSELEQRNNLKPQQRLGRAIFVVTM